jgi:hypothetical protein
LRPARIRIRQRGSNGLSPWRENSLLNSSIACTKIIAAFAEEEVTKLRGEIFFIDTMHLIYTPARELDWPAHSKIVLQNPAEFGMFERRNLAAPTQFGDNSQNYNASGHLALHGTPYT